MRIASKIFGFLLTIVISTMVGYTTLSPKVVLTNQSDKSYDELVLKMPANRLSIGPINADEEQTVYFSLQNTNGIVIYQLYRDGKIVNVGSFAYNSDSELGKKIALSISKKGDIIVHPSSN